MAWYFYLLILIFIILIFLFSFSYYTFNLIFKRKECENYLTQRDLTNTYYEKHKENIFSSFSYIESLTPIELTQISKDNLKLKAYYYNNNSDTTIIFTHGYHSNPLNNFSYVATTLHKKGYNILFIHQRAHNNSEGKYITFGIKERYDLKNWIDILNTNYSPKNIILYGLSMGCATTAMSLELDLPNNVKAAVLDCGFDNIPDLMKYQLKRKTKINPYIIIKIMNLYAKIFAKFSFYESSSSKSLSQAKTPCFFIHGTKDKTVPFSHGEFNYNSCKSEKEYAFLEDVDHVVCYYEGLPTLEERILDFIKKHTANE